MPDPIDPSEWQLDPRSLELVHRATGERIEINDAHVDALLGFEPGTAQAMIRQYNSIVASTLGVGDRVSELLRRTELPDVVDIGASLAEELVKRGPVERAAELMGARGVGWTRMERILRALIANVGAEAPAPAAEEAPTSGSADVDALWTGPMGRVGGRAGWTLAREALSMVQSAGLGALSEARAAQLAGALLGLLDKGTLDHAALLAAVGRLIRQWMEQGEPRPEEPRPEEPRPEEPRPEEPRPEEPPSPPETPPTGRWGVVVIAYDPERRVHQYQLVGVPGTSARLHTCGGHDESAGRVRDPSAEDQLARFAQTYVDVLGIDPNRHPNGHADVGRFTRPFADNFETPGDADQASILAKIAAENGGFDVLQLIHLRHGLKNPTCVEERFWLRETGAIKAVPKTENLLGASRSHKFKPLGTALDDQGVYSHLEIEAKTPMPTSHELRSSSGPYQPRIVQGWPSGEPSTSQTWSSLYWWELGFSRALYHTKGRSFVPKYTHNGASWGSSESFFDGIGGASAGGKCRDDAFADWSWADENISKSIYAVKPDAPVSTKGTAMAQVSDLLSRLAESTFSAETPYLTFATGPQGQTMAVGKEGYKFGVTLPLKGSTNGAFRASQDYASAPGDLARGNSWSSTGPILGDRGSLSDGPLDDRGGAFEHRVRGMIRSVGVQSAEGPAAASERWEGSALHVSNVEGGWSSAIEVQQLLHGVTTFIPAAEIRTRTPAAGRVTRTDWPESAIHADVGPHQMQQTMTGRTYVHPCGEIIDKVTNTRHELQFIVQEQDWTVLVNTKVEHGYWYDEYVPASPSTFKTKTGFAFDPNNATSTTRRAWRRQYEMCAEDTAVIRRTEVGFRIVKAS